MRVLIFGATGMVGQGVLKACLDADDVCEVVTIGRSSTNLQHLKLREIVHADLYDYQTIEDQLKDFDACFFCLGVSSTGMKQTDYYRITHDMTLAAADVLHRLNPEMVFNYVTGAGTDSSEKGKVFWARVKGKTENELLKMGFRGVYLFRPAVIIPVNGEVSKVRYYAMAYRLLKPVFLLMKRFYPKMVLTTAQIGEAMLNSVRRGYPHAVLEISDIQQLAETKP